MDSLRPSATKGAEEVLQARPHRNGEGIRSSIVLTHSPLRSMQQNEGVGKGNQGVLVATFNSTEEEIISWFKGKLHEFKILQSDGMSRQFHARILGFFSHECESQIFMTWEYPAGSFEARILKPLLDRRFRVQEVAPDLPFLFKGTPAEAWPNELMKGKKDPGKISLFQNLSNLMRFAVLYQYGGVYLDTDFIVLKPISVLRNIIGAQSMYSGNKNWTRLNNAVLIFDMNHPLLLRFINEFVLTFNGNKWGHNGPYLVSRVVERLGERPGFNLPILPRLAFYPEDLKKIGGLFRKPKTRGKSKWVEAKLLQLSSESYGVHLWNKESRNLKIEDGSVVARLISDRCIICKYL
ncbi:hypothetical protein V8G54_020150 [Vigna mungo]|uniref:Alpha 1,4-glycosyltransferase domain-containing protein n=1 Tax=Vigna mungo TaxID=3915 RepID=A0AAQ3RT27_VIGMU